jgi:hypothetical protein
MFVELHPNIAAIGFPTFQHPDASGPFTTHQYRQQEPGTCWHYTIWYQQTCTYVHKKSLSNIRIYMVLLHSYKLFCITQDRYTPVRINTKDLKPVCTLCKQWCHEELTSESSGTKDTCEMDRKAVFIAIHSHGTFKIDNFSFKNIK